MVLNTKKLSFKNKKHPQTTATIALRDLSTTKPPSIDRNYPQILWEDGVLKWGNICKIWQQTTSEIFWQRGRFESRFFLKADYSPSGRMSGDTLSPRASAARAFRHWGPRAPKPTDRFYGGPCQHPFYSIFYFPVYTFSNLWIFSSFISVAFKFSSAMAFLSRVLIYYL